MLLGCRVERAVSRTRHETPPVRTGRHRAAGYAHTTSRRQAPPPRAPANHEPGAMNEQVSECAGDELKLATFVLRSRLWHLPTLIAQVRPCAGPSRQALQSAQRSSRSVSSAVRDPAPLPVQSIASADRISIAAPPPLFRPPAAPRSAL